MSIDNTDNLIDSRDVIAQIEALTAEREGLVEEVAEAATTPASERLAEVEDELRALTALQEEAEGYAADWHHGETLIRDSYFEDYARELAEDMHGRALEDANWPMCCIDWERAADLLRQDYTAVEFSGVTYWIR